MDEYSAERVATVNVIRDGVRYTINKTDYDSTRDKLEGEASGRATDPNAPPIDLTNPQGNPPPAAPTPAGPATALSGGAEPQFSHTANNEGASGTLNTATPPATDKPAKRAMQIGKSWFIVGPDDVKLPGQPDKGFKDQATAELALPMMP